jgi:hypothetical protein
MLDSKVLNLLKSQNRLMNIHEISRLLNETELSVLRVLHLNLLKIRKVKFHTFALSTELDCSCY